MRKNQENSRKTAVFWAEIAYKVLRRAPPVFFENGFAQKQQFFSHSKPFSKTSSDFRRKKPAILPRKSQEIADFSEKSLDFLESEGFVQDFCRTRAKSAYGELFGFPSNLQKKVQFFPAKFATNFERKHAETAKLTLEAAKLSRQSLF